MDIRSQCVIEQVCIGGHLQNDLVLRSEYPFCPIFQRLVRNPLMAVNALQISIDRLDYKVVFVYVQSKVPFLSID